MTVELWTEKFRPTALDDYVWRDPAQRRKVEEWLSQGALPHLMFSGVQGSGKTTLAKMCLRLLEIPSGDVLEINASRERNIDTVQTKIVNFVQTWALGPSGIKYILLDEADSMSPLAQKVLRGEMEKYADSARFLITCNYPEKIIPAIHSRCQGFNFQALDRDEFIIRLVNILTAESVEFDPDDLLVYVEKSYPDLRKCINLLQQGVTAGRLNPPAADAEATKDYLIDVVNLFKTKRFKEARELIVSQAQVEEYLEIYRFFYKNLELFSTTEDGKDDALLIIRKALHQHALVADPEINLAACLVELTRNAR